MSENTRNEPEYNANEEMIGTTQEVQEVPQGESPVFSEEGSFQIPDETDVAGGIENELDAEGQRPQKSVFPDESDVLNSMPQDAQDDDAAVAYSPQDDLHTDTAVVEDPPLAAGDFAGDIENDMDSSLPQEDAQNDESDTVYSPQDDVQAEDTGVEEMASPSGNLTDDISNEIEAEKILAMMNAEDNKSFGKKKSGGLDDSVEGLDSSMFGGMGTQKDDLDPFSKDFKLFGDKNDSKDVSEEEKLLRINDTTGIIISRMVLYIVLLFIVPKIQYIDNTTYIASMMLVAVALITAVFIRPLEKMDRVLKQYFRIAFAIGDMGIAVILIYLSGSSGNLLMLAFPLITLSNGLHGINFQLAFIAMVSTMLYYSVDIAIGDFGIESFDYRIGFFVQLAVITWLISWNFVLEWLKNNQKLRYAMLKSIENIIDRLPKPIMEKLALIFNMEKLKGLEHNYKMKIEELDELIAKQNKEIAFLKENLQNGAGGEEYAVNEINSMLELENLSLKENNKKLMELNKSLESRVQMLSQELEISNTELERIYNSINEDEAVADNTAQTADSDELPGDALPQEDPAQQG